MKDKKKKREQKKKESKRKPHSPLVRYINSSRDFDLPSPNSSEEVLTAYIKKLNVLFEEHKDERGSGLLAWRMGKVLNWLKERCDKGQLSTSPDKGRFGHGLV